MSSEFAKLCDVGLSVTNDVLKKVNSNFIKGNLQHQLSVEKKAPIKRKLVKSVPPITKPPTRVVLGVVTSKAKGSLDMKRKAMSYVLTGSEEQHFEARSAIVAHMLRIPELLVWEYYGREWRAGDVVCRLVKFLQTFSICASNYLIVAIALDRYKDIRRPLSPPWKVESFEKVNEAKKASYLIVRSWVLAGGVANTSNLVLFRRIKYQGRNVCRNILYDSPPIHLRLYLTVMIVVVYALPLLIISICYVRIFQKVSQRANENQTSESKDKPGKDRKLILRQTPMAYLPRAKSKTLKTTFVIVTLFFVCSSPYCIIEIWRVYGQYLNVDAMTYSILAAQAVSNSSTNPLVFLLFNFAINYGRQGGENSAKSLAFKIFNQAKQKENINEVIGIRD
ncbi:cardioacceleratory peptide receptor-like [Limulus polyphemus]|uniref:Cardioacceleratory peptide receptor-like n=1 Tax=Limulus polyphemus TaxID=6850 RepID=A0ABM1B6Q5_LIMPO|nr:cardioacceleratory peptide receptor-like [Limulus polyphemus]